MSELNAIGNDIVVGAMAGENEDAVVIPEWPDCDPKFVLEELHKVSVDNKGENKKVFWATYLKDVSKLTEKQLSNTRSFFQKLDVNVKTSILQKAKDATIAALTQNANKSNDQQAGKKPSTTKHEVARMMHIVKDPDAAAKWGQIQNPMTRSELDSRKSNNAPAAGGLQSMAEEGNGWIGILEMFNDPSKTYQNVTVQYNNEGIK